MLTMRLVVVHRCPAVPTQANTAARCTMSRSASSFTETREYQLQFISVHTTSCWHNNSMYVCILDNLRSAV